MLSVAVHHFRLQLMKWWETINKSQLQSLWEAGAILPQQWKSPLHSGKPHQHWNADTHTHTEESNDHPPGADKSKVAGSL